MSAFNILKTEITCPKCGKRSLFEVQFKYGNTWQYVYRLGDEIKWGGNEVGKRTEKDLQIEGIGGPCQNCGEDNIDCFIEIKGNEIKSAATKTGPILDN